LTGEQAWPLSGEACGATSVGIASTTASTVKSAAATTTSNDHICSGLRNDRATAPSAADSGRSIRGRAAATDSDGERLARRHGYGRRHHAAGTALGIVVDGLAAPAAAASRDDRQRGDTSRDDVTL
jgi:hypothetical protein